VPPFGGGMEIKMTKECLLGELEEVIDQLFEKGIDLDMYEIIVEKTEDCMLSIESMRVIIPELNVSMRQGAYCVYDPDEEEYVADFSISLIYEKDETNPKNYLYWEQDGYQITLSNYFRKDDISMDSLDDLKCIIEIETNSI
jgi:hypothetical protein